MRVVYIQLKHEGYKLIAKLCFWYCLSFVHVTTKTIDE